LSYERTAMPSKLTAETRERYAKLTIKRAEHYLQQMKDANVRIPSRLTVKDHTPWEYKTFNIVDGVLDPKHIYKGRSRSGR